MLCNNIYALACHIATNKACEKHPYILEYYEPDDYLIGRLKKDIQRLLEFIYGDGELKKSVCKKIKPFVMSMISYEEKRIVEEVNGNDKESKKASKNKIAELNRMKTLVIDKMATE